MPKPKTTFTDPKPEPETDSEKPRKTTVSIPLNDDGSIDFSTMRPATAAKVKAAIGATPGVAAAQGEPAKEEKFPREFVPPLWDSVAVLTRTVGKIFFHWPNDLASGIAFTPEEKTALTEPTALMLDKYGKGLQKYATEVNFLNAVAANVGAMAQRAVSNYVAKLEPDPRQAPAAPVSPAERPDPPPPVNGHDAGAMRAL